MTFKQTVGRLAFSIVLLIASNASAAFIKLVEIDGDTFEARIEMEEVGRIKAVDVGIRIDGGIATAVANEGTSFDGETFGPANSIQDEGQIVFFSSSSLLTGIGRDAATPFSPGDDFSLGTFDWQFSGSASMASFSIDPGTLYEISNADSVPIQTGERGSVLLSVPEPTALALGGLLLASCLLCPRGRQGTWRD